VSQVDRPGGSLFYHVTSLTPPWEDDPPTILFHHGVGVTSDIWLEWLPLLADRYRLIRFDMRGFGRSIVPGPGYSWSMELLAEDALAVARAAGASRFHMVGESLGGTLGLYLAIHHSSALLSVTACSASHRGSSINRVREWRTFIEREGMTAWSHMMMPHRFDPARVPDAMYRWFDHEQAKSSADSVLDLADLLIGTDLTHDLPRITVPTLLLAPGASPFVPLETAQEIQSRVPRSEIRIFPGVRHAIAASHARECATAVGEFLLRRAAR
jgi:pimeloyl-ACP methyl ester carboxylesterase